MLIGIDLLWVRPGICGGTESYIRNLLDGFVQYDRENRYALFVTTDNAESFRHYEAYHNMRLVVCRVKCAKQWQRILWENLYLDQCARKLKTDIMFIPVYSKPRSRSYEKKGGIPYISVIHDLQAIHYPQYFSKMRNAFLRYSWRHTCKTSAVVVTGSEFCKNDIKKHFSISDDRIKKIYDPVCGKAETENRMDPVLQTYQLRPGEYDYCVSSLLPHKNLDTILRVVAKLKRQGITEKLVLSGVGGNVKEFEEKLKKWDIVENVIQTGFVSNEERDCLYKGCRLFLFPSVFEGFGLPPVEAMRMGKRVVMTKESCLYEVTDGKAVYVEHPYSVDEWIQKMDQALLQPEKTETFMQYKLETVTEQFLDQFQDVRAQLQTKRS